jgi:hypothetical protein
MYIGGGYGGPETDKVLQEQQVELVLTTIRGFNHNPDKLNLSNFEIKFNPQGKPVQITCPTQQFVSVQTTHQQKGFVACFETSICQGCQFFLNGRCPAQPGKRDQQFRLRFTQAEGQASERRWRSREHRKEAGNLRSAVEASVRIVKHPFPVEKLPVRGMFRVTCMVFGSAAVSKVWRIQRYLEAQNEEKKQVEKARSGKKMPRKRLRLLFGALCAPFWVVYNGLTPLSDRFWAIKVRLFTVESKMNS